MIEYAFDINKCKRNSILNYFGELMKMYVKIARQTAVFKNIN